MAMGREVFDLKPTRFRARQSIDLSPSREVAKNAKKRPQYDGDTKTVDRRPRLTSLRRLVRSARREKSRFKRLGLNDREHSLVVSLRALEGPDPRSCEPA